LLYYYSKKKKKGVQMGKRGGMTEGYLSVNIP